VLPLEDLDRHAAARPKQVAVASADEEWTYGRLRQESLRVAGGLAGAGVGAGDRVSLQMTNRLELVAS